MGFKIFAHSLRLVLSNLGDSLRVSGILYLLSSGLGVAVTLNMPGRPGLGMVAPLNPGQIAVLGLVYVVNLIVGIWIAVAWHRYVLIDEKPDSILPTFSGRHVLSYFGCLVLLTLAAIGVAVLTGFLFGIFSAFGAWWLAVPVAIAGIIAILIVSFRLSVVLPATSIEKPLKLRDAWAATKGTSWTILAVTLLVSLAAILLELPALGLLAVHLTFPAELWGAAIGWVFLMVNVGVATTMYGVYVERRPIPAN